MASSTVDWKSSGSDQKLTNPHRRRFFFLTDIQSFNSYLLFSLNPTTFLSTELFSLSLPVLRLQKPQAMLLIPISLLVIWWWRAKPGHCRHYNTWIKLKWNRQACQVLSLPPSPPSSLQFIRFISVQQELQERSNTKRVWGFV